MDENVVSVRLVASRAEINDYSVSDLSDAHIRVGVTVRTKTPDAVGESELPSCLVEMAIEAFAGTSDSSEEPSWDDYPIAVVTCSYLVHMHAKKSYKQLVSYLWLALRASVIAQAGTIEFPVAKIPLVPPPGISRLDESEPARDPDQR